MGMWQGAIKAPDVNGFHVMRFLGTILLLIGLVGFATAEDTSRPLPETLRSWRLAFVRDNNIWVANGDGTGQKLIIENGSYPSWSPDTSRIAFVRDNNIWLANADGSNQKPVTYIRKRDDVKSGLSVLDGSISISWHPKGDSITVSHPEMFGLEGAEGSAGIVPARKATTRLVKGSSIFDVPLEGKAAGKAVVRYDVFAGGTGFSFMDNAHPAWSPSAKQLAFTRNGDIWISRVETGSEGEPALGWQTKRLAAVASYDEPTNRGSRMNCGATQLAWHPNGRLLAYGYDRLQGSGFNEIHLLDTESGKDSVIVREGLHPCFSPDGTFIVYWTYARESCGSGICICAVSFDGKNRLKIISNGKDPVW